MSEAFKPVRKAVFPVAGLGTRLLPATKTMPKEMLTVIDRPLIQYAVDEAREAGIEQLIFVTGRGKSSLVDYFDVSFELETTMRGKAKPLDPLQPARAGYGGFIWTGTQAIASHSPELFFALRGREVMARPMKGTAARLADAYLWRFSHVMTQAGLQADLSEIRQLEVLRMRLMRDYSGLWLLVWKPFFNRRPGTTLA